LIALFSFLGPLAGSPPAATHFAFASPKESKQRKGDPQSGSLRFASGNLRCLRKAGVRANSPAAQTARGPDPAFLNHHRPSQDGVEADSGAQAKSQKFADSPNPNPNPNPIPTPTPFCMRRGAEGKTGKSSRLSERSEFERDPVLTEHRRLPVAQRRDADSRVAFSLVTFLLAKQKKVTSRRATPGQPNPKKPTQPRSEHPSSFILRIKLAATRERRAQAAIKTIAKKLPILTPPPGPSSSVSIKSQPQQHVAHIVKRP
jgi:hypothetical protein